MINAFIRSSDGWNNFNECYLTAESCLIAQRYGSENLKQERQSHNMTTEFGLWENWFTLTAKSASRSLEQEAENQIRISHSWYQIVRMTSQ